MNRTPRPTRVIVFCLLGVLALGAAGAGLAQHGQGRGVHGLRLLMAPINPMLMAERVRQQQEMNFAPDCARISAPTLIITGDERLDTVVPVAVTQRYRQLIPGSQYVRMDGTGHLGMVTQPARFARIVKEFLNAHCR